MWLEPRNGGIFAACYSAMASPCEILFETDDESLAHRLGLIAAEETWRIERKFSRYRDDSVVGQINNSNGTLVKVDAETKLLLDFCQQCFQLSEGKFDITSGILRRIWKFDGSNTIPTQAQINELLPYIGFDKLEWQNACLRLPQGMQIDLGGCVKEYAVDRVLKLMNSEFNGAILVNFGGDLATNQTPRSGPWQVGVEKPNESGSAALLLELTQGALATSGDSKRFLLKDGIRYSHILDPHTGWPVPNGPRSVTVAAGNCLEAGMLATFALLQGEQAEAFLKAQAHIHYWCLKLGT